ncbi:MAG: endonuclease/exonuclease/phosphatase family protein [Chloroflexi bacterium]|nr:endonuclease/exonuclease/phosphatase family protein [Chloroflexota bacterium]
MPEITVATLNLFNRMGEWERRAPLVIDQLEALAADVVGFQEVDLMLDQGMWIARQINLRLPARPHYRIKHGASPGKRVSYHGIATLAKLEFLEHEVLDLMTFERIAQRSVIRAGEERFVFVNTHLHHPPEAEEERCRQAEYMLDWLDRDGRGLPTVIAGDFNSYPGERTVALMKSRYRSAHEAVHGREPEKTWPTPVNTFDPAPPGALDYIYVSDGFRIIDAGLAFDRPLEGDSNLYPSDHLGLYARLEL